MMSREVLILAASVSAYTAATDRLLGSFSEQRRFCGNLDRLRSGGFVYCFVQDV
jgi:hypothetical protein